MGAVSGFSLAPRSAYARSLFLALFILVLGSLTLRPSLDNVRRIQDHLPESRLPFTTKPIKPNCSINSTHLSVLQDKYGFDDKIEYAKRYVKYVRRDIERASITKVNAKLFPETFQTFDIHNPPHREECLPTLEVPVTNSPFPATVDASDLLFGISTTFQRLNDSKTGPMKEWSHWLTDGKGHSNGAGLVLLLLDATDEEVSSAATMMENLGIDAKVQHSDSSVVMAARYLSILPTLYNHPSRVARKWLVMCDDDTFFPRMHSLLAKLGTYDHEQDLYIGTLSEDVNNIQRHGSQAFGGAGVFFSVPMAAKVTALFPQCATEEKIKEADSGWGPQGDILLRKCIYEHTDVRLTLLRDLYQLDLQGDPAGFYEAGLAPFSLHHFKGGLWHTAYPYEYAQITHSCGEDCFLQRFQTSDDYIITNGYSIAYYPRGVDFDVHQMERTFGAHPADYGWNLDYVFGPQRKPLYKTGRKIAWDLRESSRLPDGSVRQTYLRSKNDERWSANGKAMSDVDGILELIWIP